MSKSSKALALAYAVRRADRRSGWVEQPAWSTNGPDAELRLTCPTCGESMTHLTTVAYVPRHPEESAGAREDAHSYHCPSHGRFSFTNAEGLKPEPI